MSRIPQTNFLTPVVPAAAPRSYVEQIVRSPFLLNVTPAVKDNKGHSTGSRFGNDMWIEGWETEGGSYDFDASSQNIGRHLLAALGGYSVAAVAGQAGAFKHTFTPLDVSISSQLPSYSFAPQAAPGASAIDSMFPSMTASSLKLTSEGASRVSAAAAWRGSGEEITPSNVSLATHVLGVQGTQNYFYNTQSKILMSADSNGGAGFTTCELMRWNFGITNSFNDDDWGCPRFLTANNPESGALRGHLLLTDTTFEHEFSLRMRASEPAYAALKNQTTTSIVNSLIGRVIGATTANHQLDITLALTKYESVARVFNNGFAEVAIKPRAIYSNSASSIVKVELVNDVASYIG